MDYLTCSQLFYDLNLLDMYSCVFTVPMGYWWILILVSIGLFFLAEETRNGWLMVVSTIVTTGVLYTVLPLQAHIIMYLVCVFGLATALYAVFRGRDGA